MSKIAALSSVPLARKEAAVALLALALGAPAAFMFARAASEAETRRREGPLRAVLGDEVFQALKRGEKTELHYWGDGLLAPDFTLKDREGRPWRLRNRRGKLVVMNFLERNLSALRGGTSRPRKSCA